MGVTQSRKAAKGRIRVGEWRLAQPDSGGIHGLPSLQQTSLRGLPNGGFNVRRDFRASDVLVIECCRIWKVAQFDPARLEEKNKNRGRDTTDRDDMHEMVPTSHLPA